MSESVKAFNIVVSPTEADDFVLGDLRDPHFCADIVDANVLEVFQFAADMGGAGFVFTGENDADIMHNSALVNLNLLETCHKRNIKKIFYSSSACIYPAYNQSEPDNPNCAEDSAYPAEPDSDYGREKLFSERLYLAFHRNYGMEVRIARYHNIFGPEGTWCGGREKSPAAICRKVALASDGGSIEIWGDGLQTRSFLYIDECIEGTLRLWTPSEQDLEAHCRERLLAYQVPARFLVVAALPRTQSTKIRLAELRELFAQRG